MTRCAIGLTTGVILGLAATAASAETVGSVEKKIGEQMSAYKSLQFKQKTTSDITTSEGRVKTETTASFRIKRRARDRYVWRVDTREISTTKPKSGPEKKETADEVILCDGYYVYTLLKTNGQTTATRQKVENPADVFDYAAAVKNTHESFNTGLLPEQKVDGKSCYVLELVPKNFDEKNGDVVVRMVAFYDKITGIKLKEISYDKDRRVVSEMTTSELKTEKDIRDDEFIFKPPPGVKIVELKQTAGAGEAGSTATQPSTSR